MTGRTHPLSRGPRGLPQPWLVLRLLPNPPTPSDFDRRTGEGAVRKAPLPSILLVIVSMSRRLVRWQPVREVVIGNSGVLQIIHLGIAK